MRRGASDHSHRLIQEALSAYHRGDCLRALQLADRAGRLSAPRPEYVLLIGALFEDMGDDRLAFNAYKRALDVSVNIPLIRKKYFQCALRVLDPSEHADVAGKVLSLALDHQILDLVAPYLGFTQDTLVATLELEEGVPTIMAYGQKKGSHQLTVRLGTSVVPVKLAIIEPETRSQQFRWSGRVSLPWTRRCGIAEIDTAPPQITWINRSLRRVAPQALPPVDTALRSDIAAGDVDVVIIVPLFADLEVTVRCVLSVIADRTSTTRWRLLLVNDAGPDAKMREMIDIAMRDRRVAVIDNPYNLGFIGSINVALRECEDVDVVLLNSDTVVPPGWLDRMVDIARKMPGIGTITPLSNNGELVSLPVPFAVNPLPAKETIEEIDALAAALDRPPVLTPSGVGFCFYITWACRKVVGGLDDKAYKQGYLEEADYSQRVILAGFSNVIAQNVYVGHVGGASFGASKRQLVSINRMELNRRWPAFDAQCRQFMDDDPLAPIRSDLQRAWLTHAGAEKQPADIFLTSRPQLDEDWLATIRTRLPETGNKRLLVQILSRGENWRLTLSCLDGALPQNLVQTFPRAIGHGLLLEALGRFAPGSVTFLDQGRAMTALLRSMTGLGMALTLAVTDATLVCPRGNLLRDGDKNCDGRVEPAVCLACLAHGAIWPDAVSLDINAYRACRQVAASRAVALWTTAITGLERTALAPMITRATLRRRPETDRPGPLANPRPRGKHLAIMSDQNSVAAFSRLWGTLRHIVDTWPEWRITVFSDTLDDDRLMQLPGVHVTGPVSAAEVAELLPALHCDALLLDAPGVQCLHPACDVAREAGVPLLRLEVGMRLMVQPADGCRGSVDIDLDDLAGNDTAAPGHDEMEIADDHAG